MSIEMSDYPYPPQQGYPHQPPYPPPKEDSTGKYVLIAIGGCAFLLMLIGAGVFFIYFLVYKTTSGPVEVVNRQLEAIRNGNFQQAYSYCSEAFKQQTSYEDFQQFVDSYPVLKKAADFSSRDRKLNDGYATLTGSLTGTDGSRLSAEYHLVKEKELWKIQSIYLDPSGFVSRPAASEKQGSGPRFASVNIDQKSGVNNTIITIRFRVMDFASDNSTGYARIHLVQDLKTYAPDGSLLPDLSRDGIQELAEGGKYEVYTHADFSNSLTVPHSYPRGTYTVVLTIHDQIGNTSQETTAQFELR